MYGNAKLEDMIGKTLVAIDGLEIGSEDVRFVCSDGAEYRMHYVPD